MNQEQHLNQHPTPQERNEHFLKIFEEDLVNAGLKSKTIDRHLKNVNFFLNVFLDHVNGLSMEQGPEMINQYLGDFFIRKCIWSTPESIKTTAASLKKFYKSMWEHEKISDFYYKTVCYYIKEGMEIWLDDCALFNDPNSPNPFFPF